MKLYSLPLFLLTTILISGCKNDKTTPIQPDSNITHTNLKDISELSYVEIYKVLFNNSNGGFDAHGDLYGQDAVSYLSFSEEIDSCGNTLYVSNTSKDSITLALKSSFNFPGNPNKEISRAYTLRPSEKTSIGNTKLCYNGKTYNIKKELISAGFRNN